MSRIIVKNIPKEITEKQLQEHFSKKGLITDVKIMKKENGQSRKFAFIGFKNEVEGNEAIKYFNNTFLWTCKIIVESAKVQNDPSLNKPWNSNNKNSNSKPKNGLKADESKIVDLDENSKENKIKKLLELANQVSTRSKFDAINQQMQKEKDKKITNATNTENDINLNLNENEDVDIEMKDTSKKRGKDTKEADKDNAKDGEQNNNNLKIFNLEVNKLDPRRLYLKNLPFEISEDEIRGLFQKFGEITEIHIPKNYKTNQSFGYAYISFGTVESSALALGEVDKTYFQGRILHISIAEKRQDKEQNNIKDPNNKNPTGKSDYKTMKKEKLKNNFDNEANWNYLFMNQNAVIESVSQKLNIPKSELMSKDNANLAVQVAAMETSIINETKEWLNQHGFNIDALKGKRSECLRSKSTLFVKNISPTVKHDKLEEYFSRYGQLVRFLLSPSNTLAIAEFVNSKHANNCIKKLAYFELDGLPLYLEFAPDSLIEKNSEENKNTLDKNINTPAIEEKKDNDGNKIDLVGNEGKVLFITNLNFNTKENALKKFFTERSYEPKTVKIVTHIKEGKDKPVSSGFGFLEFENEETPQKILRTLQGALLHGHSLKLSLAKASEKQIKEDKLLSQKRKSETELNDYEYEGEDIESTKLLVRNLAFEADKDELKKLFSPFGEVKSVRIPKKLDGTHRGFAFVEFISHEETKKTFKSLQNTHFYGRKLVIEWANKAQNIEEMRANTERKLKASQIVTHRTQKKANVEISDFK